MNFHHPVRFIEPVPGEKWEGRQPALPLPKRSAGANKGEGMRLYVIRDLVSEDSGPIFEAKNDGVARRAFERAMEKTRGGLGEYKLLCVGEYDHDSEILLAFVPGPQEVLMNIKEDADV